MANKKNKKGKRNDIRGYGQSSSSSSSSTTTSAMSASAASTGRGITSVSSQTHDGMKSLLHQMKEQENGSTTKNDSTPASTTTSTTSTMMSSPIGVASDRFASRLQGIVDRLFELGFQDSHIELVVQALQYSITLDTALDWLCLHLPTMELPTLFTDGRVRDSMSAEGAATSSSSSSSSSLTVLKLAIPTSTTPPSEQVHVDSKSKTMDFSKLADTVEASAPTAIPADGHGDYDHDDDDGNENENETAPSPEEEKAKAEQKAWLLQQYQFVEEEDDNNEEYDYDYGKNDSNIAGESVKDPAVVETTTIEQYGQAEPGPKQELSKMNSSAPFDAAPDLSLDGSTSKKLSPDEEYLLEQQAELKVLEADVNNEANNYVRTKQENKQLQNQLKQKRQLVQGIRKRMERNQAKKDKQAKEEQQQQQQRADDNNEKEEKEEEDADGGGFLDLFGGGDDEDAEVAEGVGGGGVDKRIEQPAAETVRESATEPVSPPQPKIDAIVPPGWTGTTPRKVLEEQCKKQKLPRPKFTKLPYNQGQTLSLTLSRNKKSTPEITTAYNADFEKGSSLMDYLATKALYQMEPTLPLYRMFPPVFRDLWLSWLRQVEEAKAEEVQSRDLAKQQQLDHFLSLIQNSSGKPPGNDAFNSIEKINEDPLSGNEGNVTLRGPSHWDADGDNVLDQRPFSTTGPSDKGRRLQRLFEKRMATTAYQKMLQTRSNLPMTSYRNDILDMVANNPVTIISAQTGAGKTTQCPQFLLEQSFSEGRGDATQILVTQPRRVAATSVAERVSEELCESRLGGWVGYQIRMEAKRSADTKLLFCTTGIVLRRLQEDHNLKGTTHVIVDEVHERQQQTDVLLIALRELLRTTRPDLKIILMSATLDAKLFCSFFGNAPLVSVPGRTFPVSGYHLEDLMDATDHMIEEGSRYALRDANKPGGKAQLWVTNKGGDKRREVVDLESQTDVQDVSDLYPDYKMATRRSMDRVNEEVINYDLLEDVLNLILCRPDHNDTLLPPDGADFSKGSVLVFLPGLGEIRAMTERLQGNRNFRDSKRFEIIPMHSTLSSKDQRRAFLPAQAGCRKIILSTNIAETSVTIPDVVCVVDTGRVREVRRNKRTSTSILVTDWCSKASSKQRAGRAGRVQPGICLKLYSSRTAQSVMKPASEPELRRVPLEEVCLSILASGFSKDSMEFLSKAPQPPTDDSVKAAVDVLEEVGAIEVIEHSKISSKRMERLTPLGRHLAKLPVDVRLGKMLIFGALFRCLDHVLTIAASLSSQSPFSTYMADGSEAKAKQRAFCDPDSDFVTFCNVWDSFNDVAAKSTSAARKFCQSNYLNYTALREIGDARRQFLDLLCSIGFVKRNSIGAKVNSRPDPSGLHNSVYDQNSGNMELLNAVICAGLYPNVAHLTPTSNRGDYTMFHKKERLFFHNKSVNSRKKVYSDSWVVFHEKFGTPSRVSVSTTCSVHPFALLLLGGSVAVKHTQRLVVVDGWIEISMAAQIGVIMKELRKQVDALLVKMIEDAVPKETEHMGTNMVQGIVNLLASG